MHSRCCWPPESANADFLSLSLTSSQSAACAQRLLDDVVEALALPDDARPERDVVVDRLRERVRLLEHHADPAAHLDRVDVGARRGLAVVRESARATSAPGMRSFMRLNERSSVLLPHPDGPMSAVMRCACTSSETPSTATTPE